MKVTTFIFLLLSLIGLSFITHKELKGPKITLPPGTVVVKEGLYMDKYEVSNGAWKEYTNWLMKKENDSIAYAAMQPDSGVWLSKKYDRDKYVDAYYQSGYYDDYPVVGISYEQATAFCVWRTERVNELLERIPNPNFRKIEYRLPTEKEWELAASGKIDSVKYPYGTTQITKKIKGDSVKAINCYVKEIDAADYLDKEGIIAPVSSYYPNAYEIYNMIGNVGEMVSEKGLAKGGHYALPLEYCSVLEKMSYKSPNRYLGFRCVCVKDNTVPAQKDKASFKKETKKEDKKEKSKKKVIGFEQEQNN
jgi:hypothetical protein